jgi:EmrB/QacA subfamily drug resistance transporter
MPVGMTILMSVTRPEERGRMMAVMGIPMLFGPVLGPTLGGLLVQDVSWRFIFFINLPIGLVGAFLSLTQLREPPHRVPKKEPLDLIGLLLVTPAVVGLVYGLSQPGSYGWGSAQTILPLVGGVLLLVAFCLYELRTRYPLIDIRVFHDGAFSASMMLNFLIALGLFGAIFLFPLFLQQIQGYSALNAGLLLGFQGLGAAVAMPISGILTDKIGARRVVPFGLAVLTGATIWMASVSPETAAPTIATMLALRGFGMGFSMMPSMSTAFITLAPDRIARATSISNIVQRVASGLGIAIMATVLTNRISANLPRLPQGSASTGGDLAAAHLPPAIKTIVLDQAAKGFNDTFWVSVGFVVIAFPMTLLLRRALSPGAVRSYAVRQASEGIVLGMAALRMRDGGLDGSAAGKLDAGQAFRVFAEAAATRLQRAVTLLKAGTYASGLVPQPGLSLPRRVAFAVVLVAALVASAASIVHGYRPPSVPSLPPAQVHAQAPGSSGEQAARVASVPAAPVPAASPATPVQSPPPAPATQAQQAGVPVLGPSPAARR